MNNKDIVNAYKYKKAKKMNRESTHDKMTPYLYGIGIPTLLIGVPVCAALASPVAGVIAGAVVAGGVISMVAKVLPSIGSSNHHI